MSGVQNDSPVTSQKVEMSDEVRNAHPLARFFFLKTTFGILMTAILLVGGIFAYNLLAKEARPDLNIPRATITTTWPGADPLTIEEQITDVIEQELTSLQGLRQVDSSSFDSMSIIMVEFDVSVDAVDAMIRLRAAVADAEAGIPADAERPVIDQVSVDDRPILTLALHGDADATQLGTLARSIRDRLERVPGVNEVVLGGEREEVVQILLHPDRLLALSLSPTRVRDAVRQANIDQPFGEIRSSEIGAVVRLEGRFRTLDDLRTLPVATLGDGFGARTVRLDEVASVERTLEREDQRAFYSSAGQPFRPALEISVKKMPGADTIQVIANVRAALDTMTTGRDWPEGVSYSAIQDQSEQIWDSLSEVFSSGFQAMLIVFVVLFFTIAWREAVITGLSIPVTFAGVLLVLLLLGSTLNELVIIGMVIALVLIIDVFIILLEGLHDEIYRNGATFGQAVLRTARRYAIPAFAAQITTILALTPLMAIGGTAGVFIRVLPLTTIICLILAFLVAMLAAMPLSRFLLGNQRAGLGHKEQSRADYVTQIAMDRLEAWNASHVVSSRKQAWLWVLGAAAMFVLAIVAFSHNRIEMYPVTDGERLGINIELPPTTQLEASQRVADAVGDMLREKPYLASTIKLVGRKSPFAGGSTADSLQPDEAVNFIGFSSTFVDRSDRKAASYTLADELREEISTWLSANVAGAELLVVAESSGPTPSDPIEIELSGGDMDVLLLLARQVQQVLAATRGVVDARDSLGAPNPQIALRPDREAADFLGISPAELAGQIRLALSSDTIGSYATADGTDDIDIRIGTAWPNRPSEPGSPANTEELALIRAYTQDGRSIPLLQVVESIQSEGALSISRRNGERAISVLAKNEGRTVGEIMDEVLPKVEELQTQWPAGYQFAVAGEAADTEETMGSAGVALALAVILVLGVMVIVFDSFRQSMIIFVTMPLAVIGAFIGFYLFGIAFSFMAMVGLISLIGIVVNTGIIMVDTMNRFLAEGKTPAEAAAAGSARRLRPVLTTSLTTIIGLIPLAISSEMYRSLTLIIIFGLISATILSLFIVPAFYLLLTPKEGKVDEQLD